MSSGDTIYSLASGKGRCGVAVIRISGPNANHALSLLTQRVSSNLPKPRRMIKSTIFGLKTDRKLDQGLIVRFVKPESFTGEDVVELYLHGGPAVIKAVIGNLAEIQNLRPAEAGEFTRRAFENGRMNLIEVEGLADLINAETEMQRQQAFRQLEGELGELYERWRATIVNALAYMEAHIDFADAELSRNEVYKNLRPALDLVEEMHKHLLDGRRGEILRDGLRVAIVGAPNSGKSSLLNALARREVAITAASAGTTRDVLEVKMDIAGFPIYFFDTAGIRASDEEVEVEGIRRALECAKEADLRIVVSDVASPTKKKSLPLVCGDKDLIVHNKCDLLADAAKGQEHDSSIQLTSAKTGEGLDDLIKKITEWADKTAGSVGGEAAPITRARHRLSVESCVEHLVRAGEVWSGGGAIELVTEDVRLAIRCIGQITGEVELDELLDIIFSDFCIGK